MARARVGFLGASGETGGSILEALFTDGSFDISALVRLASIFEPADTALQARSVELRPLDLTGPEASMVESLSGISILISVIGPRDQLAQLLLVAAAKKANI